ncbi:MAG: tetratricopeptide repeat protein [Caldisericia bacterium]
MLGHAEAKQCSLRSRYKLEMRFIMQIKRLRLIQELTGGYNDRGNVYCILDKMDKALLDYNKAIKLKKDFSMAYNNRGNAYLILSKKKEALQDFISAIKYDKTNTKAYRNELDFMFQ